MSATDSPNGHDADLISEGGILGALPRARPQRASPRRAAARAAAPTKAKEPAGASERPTATQPAGADKQPTATRRASAGKRSAAKPVEPPTPKQGYEPEEEVELGATVHPPSGVELVESVADIVGELAGSGLAVGGRLLKDAFSLLRRP